MRWERLFADLENELAAAAAAERDAEIAERTRTEVAKLRLVDRLRVAGGVEVTVALLGGGDWCGAVLDTGPDWVLLGRGHRGDALVSLDAVAAVTGLPPWSAVPGSEGRVAERFRVGAVLRGIARDRAAVRVVLRDGGAHHGTVDRVGADFLELAEHDPGEPRRPGAVRRVRLVPFSALAAVVTPPA
ncbi:MAG TPA: hypothetical protein VF053_20435 [Streptosporangiales bacterium]